MVAHFGQNDKIVVATNVVVWREGGNTDEHGLTRTGWTGWTGWTGVWTGVDGVDWCGRGGLIGVSFLVCHNNLFAEFG